MQITKNNIIRTQRFNLAYRGKTDGFALQNEFADWYYAELFPDLQSLLDEVAPGEMHLQLDQVKIDIAIKGTANWKDQLRKELLREIRKQLAATSKFKSQDSALMSKPADHFFLLLKNYLLTGALPWWTNIRQRAEFDEALQDWLTEMPEEQAGVYRKELRTLLRSKVVSARMLGQFNEACFDRMVRLFSQEEKAFSGWKSFKEDLLLIGKRLPAEEIGMLLKYVKEAVLTGFAGAPFEFTKLAEDILPLLLENNSKNLADLRRHDLSSDHWKEKIFPAKEEKNIFQTKLLATKEIKPRKKSEEEESLSGIIKLPDRMNEVSLDEKKPDVSIDKPVQTGESVFIVNAGIVITAPFLPTLFGRLGWINETQLIFPDQALYLLHYLAKGEPDAAEFEFVLPKILCGLTPEYVVQEKSQLTEAAMTEADELLRSVIEYWNILGNTTVNGLRSSFLQREGKLTATETGWLLTVKQEGYDMLLQHLPWNIDRIRLPWMLAMLKTEWVY